MKKIQRARNQCGPSFFLFLFFIFYYESSSWSCFKTTCFTRVDSSQEEATCNHSEPPIFFFLFFLFMILEISSRTNIWLMTSTLNRFRGKIRNRCIDRAIHIIRRYSDTTHADPQTTKRSLYSLFLKFIQLKRYFYSTFF
jgi:hypothetical protein